MSVRSKPSPVAAQMPSTPEPPPAGRRAIELASAVVSRLTGGVNRLGVGGPLVLISAQLFIAYLRLRPPAAAVTPGGNLTLNFPVLLYRRFVYSDLLTLYSMHHLVSHPMPYWDVRIEYPVVTALFIGAAALFPGVRAYLLVSSLGLWVCALGCVLVLWSVSRRATWWFAACPLVLVFGLLNWDLLGILAMFLGWRAYQRQQFVRSAVWLTLGVFAKLFPLALLAFCLVDLVRRRRAGQVPRGTVRAFARTALLVTLLLNVPFAATSFVKWATFYSFNAERPEFDGLLFHITSFASAPWEVVDGVLGLLVIILVFVGARFVLRGGSPAAAAALVFVGFLVFTKVYDPQYVLWLFAFALLAEWPAWALSLLSLMGLLDFGNAVVSLYLKAVNSPVDGWWLRYPWRLGVDVRLGTLIVCAAGVLVATLRNRTGSITA